jgi:hypothetical protein
MVIPQDVIGQLNHDFWGASPRGRS